ncbi:MAG: transcription termination/antitermination protein NusG [Limisphaerales bacterium]
MNLDWFCLKTQSKREHIAAEHLRAVGGIETFLPRIRFQRNTARGLVWFTEALFPGYLFARFDRATHWRAIQHAQGVRGVVHFGDRWPTLPEATIAELRQLAGDDSPHVIASPLQPGEEVELAAGAFRGWKAIVTRVLPARQRVLVLLEFLGQQTGVEVPLAEIIRPGDPRRHLAG